jgi:hypothetical protein
MWRLKSCPRCKGDMFIDKDGNSWYEECLQCGFSRELVDMVVVNTQPPSMKNKSSARRAKAVAG